MKILIEQVQQGTRIGSQATTTTAITIPEEIAVVIRALAKAVVEGIERR